MFKLKIQFIVASLLQSKLSTTAKRLLKWLECSCTACKNRHLVTSLASASMHFTPSDLNQYFLL